MNASKKFWATSLIGTFLCLSAGAEVLDRPSGIKIGDRLTLRPYVSFSVTYDSNVEAGGSSYRAEEGDVLWTIAPNLWLAYNAENWSLLLSGYYNYRQYSKSCFRDRNDHNYGEDLRWNWANSSANEKGWSLVLGQSFKQVTMAEDMATDDGGYYNGDTRQLQLAAALQRRFNEYVHSDVNANYYWLDYLNDMENRYSYYGWDRWMAGLEVGYAPTKWTDIILSGSYQGYSQDNVEGTAIDSESTGYTFQAGLGSYMTDRISYRLLAGWSRFEYGGGASTSDGFVYTGTANWKIGETWNTMILATSYYQPSERQITSKSRVDAVSWGLAKVMVRGKLRATLDLRYRRETHEYVGDSSMAGGDYDYILDIVTGRVGLSYSLNRFLSVFANAEYQRSMNDSAEERNNAYDYDRYRVSVGVTLTY